MKFYKIFLITAFFFVTCLLGISAQQKDKIVISSLPNEGVPESLIRIFMGALGDGLTESGRYEVLTNRRDFIEILGQESEFQEGGWVNDRELIELGRAAGANFACFVEILEFDGTYFISSRVTNLERGVQTASFTLQSDRRGIPEAARQLARSIAAGRNLTTGQTTTRAVAPKCCYSAYTGGFVDCEISNADEDARTYRDAVEHCSSKGEGWRLPSRDELLEIYKNRIEIVDSQGGRGEFSTRNYWTSTRRNDHEHFTVNFNDGQINHSPVTMIRNVFRCVRVD